MKKLILFLLLLFALALTVFSHPGRTDENGGHTDTETGEYHYHHGYPAHQHEDLDGDGIIDCPYDFVDKTGQSSHGSSERRSAPANKPSVLLQVVGCIVAFSPLIAAGLCFCVISPILRKRGMPEKADSVKDNCIIWIIILFVPILQIGLFLFFAGRGR